MLAARGFDDWLPPLAGLRVALIGVEPPDGEATVYAAPAATPDDLAAAVAEPLDLIVWGEGFAELSDQLAGLMVLQRALRPGGVLLLATPAVDCFEHSYVNFGRTGTGPCWEPTALCLQDLGEFAGFDRPEVRFPTPGQAQVRMAKRADGAIAFKRGVNLAFADRRDEVTRTRNSAVMAPAADPHASASLVAHVGRRAAARVLRAARRH